MNISNLLNRLLYWGRRYHRRAASHSEPYLRDQALQHLENASGATESSRTWHLGSWSVAVSIAVLVGVLGTVLLTGAMSQWWWDISSEIRQQLADYTDILWQVEAALLSVGFVVIVLLVQILGNREDLSGPVFREYIRRSGILTAAFLGLASIGVMGATAFTEAYGLREEKTLAQATAFNSVVLAANLFVIGLVYWRVLRFSRPGHGIELTTDLLKQDLLRRFRQLILEDLARRVLFERASALKIEHWTPSARQSSVREVRYPVDDQELRVVDIDLDALRRLTEEVLRTENQTGPLAWIHASIGTVLSPADPTVGALRADAPSFAARRFPTYFVVDEDSTDETQWETFVRDLRNRINQAIVEHRPTGLSNLLDVYEEALKEYARHVQLYDSEVVSSIANDPLSKTRHFKPDEVIYRDFAKLGARAIKENDQALIGDVLYFPTRILRIAESWEDPDLFKRFAESYIRFYNSAHQLPADSDARALAIDSCWRRLTKTGERLNLRHFDAPGNRHEIINNKPYALHILRVFNRLAKRALDLRDDESFCTFFDKFDALFGDLPQTQRRLQAEKFELEKRGDSTSWEGEPSEEYRLLKEAEGAVEEIIYTKSLIRFGLAAWILDLYEREQIKEDEVGELIRRPSSHFESLEDLHHSYTQAVNDTQDGLRWRVWGHERVEERWLRRFYVVLGLELINGGAKENIDLPPSPQLRTELNEIEEICERIRENGHPLRDLNDLEGRVESFLRPHRKALRRQEEKEADQLIEEDLDADKAEAFKEAFFEHWEENNLDRLLAPFGSIEMGKPEEEGDSGPVLQNPLESKKYFTNDAPEEVASRLGKQFGRGLGQAERKQLVYVLKAQLEVEMVTEEQFAEHFKNVVEEGDFEANLLLVGKNVIPFDLFPSDDCVPEWKENGPVPGFPGYLGRLGEIPICRVPEGSKTVIVLNADSVSASRQVQGGCGEPRIEVVEITEEKAREMIEKDPSLKAEGESESETIHRLRQSVAIERENDQINFDIDEDAGVVFVVQKEDLE